MLDIQRDIQKPANLSAKCLQNKSVSFFVVWISIFHCGQRKSLKGKPEPKHKCHILEKQYFRNQIFPSTLAFDCRRICAIELLFSPLKSFICPFWNF